MRFLAISKKTALLGFLIVLSLFFSLFWLGNGALIDSDEAHYARVFHESFQRGDFLNFTSIGQPWFEKPPLYFWLMSGSVQIFGENEFSMRLPSALMIVFSVLLTWLITLELVGNKAYAFVAGFILLTTGAFLEAGRQVRFDVPVTFAILFSFYSFIRGLKRSKWLLGVGLGIGIGILFKSVIGLLSIPLILIMATLYGKWTWLKSKYLWFGGILSILIAAPWHIYQTIKFGSQFWVNYFGYHIFRRFTEPILGTAQSLSYYIRTLFFQTEPWFLITILFTGFLFWRWYKTKEFKSSEAFLILSVIFIFLLFTISRTRLFYYLVPIYPLVAIFIAITLNNLLKKTNIKKPLMVILIVPVVLIALVSAGFQSFDPTSFDSLILPRGVISKRVLAEEEKAIGKILSQEPIPLYVFNWVSYRDTLNYYGNAPKIITVASKTNFQISSFLLMPTKLFNPNLDSSKAKIVYSGKLGTLLRAN